MAWLRKINMVCGEAVPRDARVSDQPETSRVPEGRWRASAAPAGGERIAGRFCLRRVLTQEPEAGDTP
jgi:hypothetical protein